MTLREAVIFMKFLIALAFVLAFAATANAQLTCTPIASAPPTIPQQNCLVTAVLVPGVPDATHSAATSFEIRRSDGGGAKVVIGTINAPATSLQNAFTDAGNVPHCWDAIAVNSAGSAPPSPQACWTTPAIIFVPPPVTPPNPVVSITVGVKVGG